MLPRLLLLTCLSTCLSLLALSACDPGDGTSSVLPDTLPQGDADFGDAGSDVVGPGDVGPGDSTPTPDAITDTPAPDTTSDATPDTITPPDAAPDTTPDAALDTTPDATPDAAPDTTTGPTGELAVGVILSEIDSQFLKQATASARFTAPQPTTEPSQTFGACAVAPFGPSATTPDAFGYDAGTITASGTTPSVTLSPVSEGSAGTGYTSNLAEDHEDLLPAGGGLITVTGEGGPDIDPFSIVLQAPQPLGLASPPTGLGVTTSADKDLAMSWNAGAGDSVVVSLTPVDQSFQPIDGSGLVCILAGDATTLTVPKEAIAVLMNGSSSRIAIIGLTRATTKTGEAGAATVSATAIRSTGGPLTFNQ